MRRHWPLLTLVIIALVFLTGLAWLYRLRIVGGDVFPAYSSFRADPLGTRALYEALAAQPGLRVERWLKPLEKIDPQPTRTLFLLGMNRAHWEQIPVKTSSTIDATVRAGGRVVVILAAEQNEQAYDEFSRAPSKTTTAEDKPKPSTTDNQAASDHQEQLKRPARDSREFPTDWAQLWGATIKSRLIIDRGLGARAAPGATHFPPTISWKSDLYLEPAVGSEWKVLYTRGGSPVMMELALEKGSIVLATDSYFTSNEALQKNRAPTLLAWLVGNNQQIIFSESHLGVEEQRGVASLARHYGLSAGLLVFVFLALLFVWRRAALFIPPPPEEPELRLNYNQTLGLETLLRRVLPSARLLQTCTEQWARTAKPAEAEKLKAILGDQPPGASPAAAYNAAVRTFRRH